jgi:nitroreductase
MTPDAFRDLVTRAALAPSVHNTQPARFRLNGDTILISADPALQLAAGDPEGRDAGLSCGAAAEAMVLALSGQGIAATLDDRWEADDRATLQGYRLAAVITVGGRAEADPLASALDRRFTHRGMFRPVALADWRPPDAVLVTDPSAKARIASLNDAISLQVLRRTPDRAELLRWMRLSPRHPDWQRDGMNRDALRMGAAEAQAAQLVLGPFWGMLNALRLTPMLTAEAAKTQSAQVIAAFHRPSGESPVTSGRAYLRLTLDAAARGLAMWPMAALADDPVTRLKLEAELGVPPGHHLIQMIRFGAPDRPAPPRVRRPADDLIV